jgi:hypothetical protein
MAVIVPDLPELFEEAFERAGLEMRSGYDLKSIRRSLNLLTLEWANKGLNLFTIEAGTLPLAAGVETYTLPTGTIDIIEHQLRTGTGTSQVDTALERISVSTYAQPLKQVYDEQFALAAEEDRDRSSVSFTPFNTMMIGGV